MPTRLRASARPSSPAASDGSASGSVRALRTFCIIVSASSVRLTRLMSDGSDFDIFADPSRRLMIRAASAGKNGRSEEHTSELQLLKHPSYSVLRLNKQIKESH